MTDKKNKITFFGGVPTTMDVKRLLDLFGIPLPGTIISYSAVSEAIGIDRKQSRFWTITQSWRSQLRREHNVILKAVSNTGFECLDAPRRVTVAFQQYKHGVKSMDKAAAMAAATDRTALSPEQQRICDHVQARCSMIKLAEATAARQLKYDDPTVKSLAAPAVEQP